MWSSKQTTANNTASDNKKKEEVVVDDCRCSSEAVDAASSHTVEGSTGQPQQLNVFDHNSKRQTTTTTASSTPFGGNLTPSGGNFDNAEGGEAAIAKQKEFSGEYTGETVDSGFVSGPLSGILQEPDEGGADIGTGTGGGDTTHKFNITVDDPQQQNRQQQQKQQQQQEEEEENIVLDSGCITEDFTEDNVDVVAAYEGAVGGEEQRKTNEQLKQVQHELSNATVAAAASSTTTVAASSNDPMLFKQNVDSGMSEWFCNLSLQSEATPRPQQQSQQQQVAGGIAMNNLDSTGQRAVTMPIVVTGGNAISFNQNSNRQQQQAAGNSAINNNTTATTTNVTPSSAWEQFYQQNDDGDTPMHLACISGYVDVVAALIRMAPHPCLFNIQNDVAQTPLHLAALTAQPKILRMLLIAGAEPTIRDRHGNTALHLACISGEEQCVRALTIPISASEINEAHRLYGHRSNDKTVSYLSCALLPSDLEIRNYDGERCVHLAAQSGHIDILRILVLYGADINAREGKSGRTPLHIAIECCNEDLANFLLDECQKLNLETATYAGLTAYQVACVNNKSQMQNILEKRGAEPLTPPDSDYDSSDIETDLDESKIYDRFGDPGYFISYNGGNPMTVA